MGGTVLVDVIIVNDGGISKTWLVYSMVEWRSNVHRLYYARGKEVGGGRSRIR